ncbi:hypothetical protein H6M51_21165 [Rhizobium sp. AQ_MP]|uniref:hypothetical protein n=1 Tax=Rhizobium sp. AQ_MP TaxID=2761536 RepID=UPI00163A2B64|nr:hypothetical protein [Rhizobium sp. AQ_MP]MBC2775376.1 hypothetical protein [Rhizobium sp. AQ_MP]
MTENDSNHRENGVRKLGDQPGSSALDTASAGRDTSEDASGAETPQHGGQDAIREASRLGTPDAYLVDQDMEDLEERQGEEGPDGRPSPLANADNPER